MDNAISWFEIPATDIDRAQKFYETIFQIQMQPMDFQQTKMRMFPLDDPMKGIGGTLIDSGGFHKPSATDLSLIHIYVTLFFNSILCRKRGGCIQVFLLYWR